MHQINYTTARANLARIMQDVCADRKPIAIHHENKCSVVLMSLADYNAMQETNYLLSQPANAIRLLTSITELQPIDALQTARLNAFRCEDSATDLKRPNTP